MTNTEERFTITGNTRCNGSSDLSQHQGKKGVIVSNDGFGLCRALLDDGTKVTVWNYSDVTMCPLEASQ